MQKCDVKDSKRRLSFNSRLIILLVVMLLPFIAFSCFEAIDINKKLEIEAENDNLTLARAVAQDIDDYITATGELLIPIANSRDVRTKNYPAVTAWFKKIAPDYPYYVNLIFVDADGYVRSMALNTKTPEKSSAKGTVGVKPKLVNTKDTMHYKRAMPSTGIAVGDFMYGKLTGKPVVHVTYPVFDYSNKQIGYVAAAFDLTRIQNKLMQTNMPEHSLISVMDQKGTIIARSHDPQKWVGKTVAGTARLAIMQGKAFGTDRTTYKDGVIRVVGYASTAKAPWFVGVGLDVEVIQARVRKQFVYHFGVFLPLILLAIFGWIWIGRDVNRLHQETEHLTLVDPLTGLWNHRKLDQDSASELSRARRYRENLTFAMIDIDYFKHYNDNNGHQTGDTALHNVAKIIQNSVRDCDSIYRYGGEEISVLLPNTDTTGAISVIERIRQDIERASFLGEETQPNGKLTVSIGFATYPVDSISKEGLVKSADVALYRAKDKGRNRIEAYSASISSKIV